MPDDDRSRRRLGDATKSRIENLASGWSVDGSGTDPGPSDPTAPDAADTDPATFAPPAPPAAPGPAPMSSRTTQPGTAAAPPNPPRSASRTGLPPLPAAPVSSRATQRGTAPPAAPIPSAASGPARSKPKTNPPPPPGSPERKALEEKIEATASRERLGDATRSRIADLASGWSVDGPRSRTPSGTSTDHDIASSTSRDDESTGVLPPERKRSTGLQPVVADRLQAPTGATRSRTPTGARPIVGDRSKQPSIPPLSPSVPPPVASERSKPASIPPPPPGSPERTGHERSKPASIPPATTGPKYPRAGYDGPAPPLAASVNDPIADVRPGARQAPIADGDAFPGTKLPATAGELMPRAPAASTRASQLDVPDDETPVEDLVDDDGEDDHDDRDRGHEHSDHGDPHAAHDVHAESERRRSHADASSGTLEAGTEKFERGDPTDIKAPAAPDATEIHTPRSRAHMTGGTLRRSAALRRKRGLYGDVRYVFTTLFGVRRSRLELGELDHRQQLRATSRRRHLITAGRAAATMDNFDHPALGRSRDALSQIEEERAKHQGAVAASDAELDRVRRDRETNIKAHAEATAKADAELAELAKKLEPLEKEALAARKKAAELRDELQRIDKKINETEALLVSVKGEKLDKAGVQADIATLKANKQSVLRDEPKIAAALDQLNPRLAALEATRSELQKKKVDLDKADQDDQRRTLELLEAIGAKRKVVERASADAEVARDNALFELGERLYVDRPKQLTPELSPIDRIDLEIGEDERRAMEIKEILSNIDKAKFARGMAMIILALGAVGTLVWLIYTAA